jgi:hypothetical protein
MGDYLFHYNQMYVITNSVKGQANILPNGQVSFREMHT